MGFIIAGNSEFIGTFDSYGMRFAAVEVSTLLDFLASMTAKKLLIQGCLKNQPSKQCVLARHH
jgi:hypothetical protein